MSKVETWMMPWVVGEHRAALRADATGSAIEFAKLTNAAAIRMWPTHGASAMFDESVQVLRAAIAGDVDVAEARRLLVLVLHNSAQLRAFEATDDLDELPQALDDAREAAQVQATLFEAAASSPLRLAREEAREYKPDLVAILLTEARIESACGLTAESRITFDHARSIADELGPGGEWCDWIDAVRRELTPLRDLSADARPERRLWLWVA